MQKSTSATSITSKIASKYFLGCLVICLLSLSGGLDAQVWDPEFQEKIGSMQLADSASGQRETEKAKDPLPSLRHEGKGREGFFYLLIGLLAIVVLNRQTNPKSFRNFIQSFSGLSAGQRYFRDREKRGTWTWLFLDINFFLVFSIFLYQLLGFLGWEFGYQPWVQIWILLVLLVVLIFLKSLMLSLVNALFRVGDVLQYYSFEIFHTNRLIGLWLIPCLICLFFAPESLSTILWVLCLSGLGVLLIYRTIKVLGLSLGSIVNNKLHFLLYICTLEIVPVLLLVKLYRIL